jgi:hypothetical protein
MDPRFQRRSRYQNDGWSSDNPGAWGLDGLVMLAQLIVKSEAARLGLAA